MAYWELVKNFEKIRSYMREFYVYGFKSRSEFDKKSMRSYDNEKRRLESWLGDYMNFTQTPEGKKIFLSVDNRSVSKNPLYKAWKSKSFTDGDITLHFIIFDILFDQSVKKSLKEIMQIIDSEYLSHFENPPVFDESTIRKKLKEYIDLGIICTQKQGKQVFYYRAEDIDISSFKDAILFFSEIAPLGVVGSFLLDKISTNDEYLAFKHHYITDTMDSEILENLLVAMHKKCFVFVQNHSPKMETAKTVKLVPLKIFISTQNGKQNLIAYNPNGNSINSYRLDYLSNVVLGEVCKNFDVLKHEMEIREKYVWGVNFKWNVRKVEHVEFIIQVKQYEQYVAKRLIREARIGTVEKIDEEHYRFSCDVFDSRELIPWVRTFISRITRLNFSNRTVENKIKDDIKALYEIYGISGGDK